VPQTVGEDLECGQKTLVLSNLLVKMGLTTEMAFDARNSYWD
jgi:hypothetical protein